MDELLGNANGGNGGLNFGLNETQQQVITLIAENPNINIQEIANKSYKVITMKNPAETIGNLIDKHGKK